ncbi:hypothetical protein HanPSC8_Chr08g0337141 [Helianthus annuus]|nr:hypothetical protein HanPSC8_Chr08g0337141 [Helianthus annuus]
MAVIYQRRRVNDVEILAPDTMAQVHSRIRQKMAYAALMPANLGLEGSHVQIHRTTTSCLNLNTMNYSQEIITGNPKTAM